MVHRRITAKAVALTGNEYSFCATPDQAGDLVITVSTRGDLLGRRLSLTGTTVGLAFSDSVPLRLNDFCDLGGDSAAARVLPVCEAEASTGVLVCVAPRGRQFTENELDMAAAYAAQAGLALHLATAQRRMRELDVLTDRDRIARDLHDHVISPTTASASARTSPAADWPTCRPEQTNAADGSPLRHDRAEEPGWRGRRRCPKGARRRSRRPAAW
ncbi:GAF domain-containing protein [Candidatus Mycolicibacterium alkanivorans]|uniref:GAF domain-containing protein n=1 Tax=Candidatus Mycolicibacterium alkanivorans TaxID=2954114 RepID=A0ABS9YTU7_9MYCO|nr:GAF domain-containing protein [Candidatus Mycolicibacterium alkanivorans]MCI4674653.1 hypothetical protein [Candidatus Mycolicibacterium alkanivorans]